MDTLRAQIKQLHDTRHDWADAQPENTSTTLLVSELGALWDGMILLAEHLDEKAS